MSNQQPENMGRWEGFITLSVRSVAIALFILLPLSEPAFAVASCQDRTGKSCHSGGWSCSKSSTGCSGCAHRTSCYTCSCASSNPVTVSSSPSTTSSSPSSRDLYDRDDWAK